MELTAVQSALEATLYRQNMLKLISEIKCHTSEKKAYKKLVIFLETPSDKVDVAVQTDNTWTELQRADNIQSVYITSNCEELSVKQLSPCNDKEDVINNETGSASLCSVYNKTASPTINSTSFHELEHGKFNNESDEDASNKMMINDDMVKKESDILTDLELDVDIHAETTQPCIQNEDENSRDSLLQHMEDMFCESDDSSDLTTLIEKHSGISKAIIDKEINQMCQETDSFLPQSLKNVNCILERNNTGKSNAITNNAKTSNTSTGTKHSFSYYKEMKLREANKSLVQEPETAESRERRRRNGIWFVERVHQVSKLKAKMTELSLTNYRKYGRVKQKFIELFGESDDEESMPDSPICIEEHLTACKERIAPWIVKHLMPFYKKRRIKDRALFKTVAKHIADMLIIENTFPEQDCVSKCIDNYFKNKKFIKTKQDIYV